MLDSLKKAIGRYIERALITLLPLGEVSKPGSIGASSDTAFSIDYIPTPLPDVGTVHRTAADLCDFLVVSVDARRGYLVICEVGTENYHDIDAGLFELLFQPAGRPPEAKTA